MLRPLLKHREDVLPIVGRTRLGLVVDFDGTIAEIAPTPDQAVISPVCAEALPVLADKLTLVAVVSGRSAEDVRRKVGLGDVVYAGNHGAEYIEDGRTAVVDGVEDYRAVIGAVFEHLRATADGPGVDWEDKGLSASVHFRMSPDKSETQERLAEALSTAPGADGLDVFWGKMVLELRALGGVDKGYAIRRLAEQRGLNGMFFIGDDVTDVDAVRGLRQLIAQGKLRGAGVAVTHPDAPRELTRAADFGLSGVEEVGTFLLWLADAVDSTDHRD
jgi:trehalose 6-phosphate phosphatase